MIYVKEFSKTAKKAYCLRTQSENTPTFAPDFKITVCENMRINV